MSAATRWITFYLVLILGLIAWGATKMLPAETASFKAVAMEKLDDMLGLGLGLANQPVAAPAPAPVKLAQAPSSRPAQMPLPEATTASTPVAKQAGTAPFPPDNYSPPGATAAAPATSPAPVAPAPAAPVLANTYPAAPPPPPAAARAPEPAPQPVPQPAMVQPPEQAKAPPRAAAGREVEMSPALRAAWAEARRAYWSQDLPAARDKYLALVKENTNEPDIAGELGNVYFTEGRYQDAAAQYYEAGMRMVRSRNPGAAGSVIGILHRLDPAQANALRQAMFDAEQNMSQAR